ncbi:GmrSD restriction endonuclease domain-containing protein [Pseudarthrobacter sp. 1C304]|uniref:GmrSD restriction endonuclease domain-containing protein n=1 Tax=Pseudarthrobacter sp. 1C304 TaxID=3457438 RepID=UPI003FD4E46E
MGTRGTAGAGRPRSGSSRSGRLRGGVDWISAGLAGLILVSATACASPGTAPAAGPTAVESSSESAAPPTAAGATQSAGVPAADQAQPPQPSSAGTALEVLATIPVKGRAPKTGYSRDQFGQAWADVDRNGCDTRNDMLRRDLSSLALKPGTGDCVVLSGILNDPYTSTLINFLRGSSTSDAVQIDHVVALSDAWQKGAQQLSEDQRLSFANDPLNLLAVDGPTNQRKSDGDAATWLPPNKSFRCEYVARQISVKAGYGLWVTQAEHDAMARVLGDCPDTAAPTASTAVAAPPARAEPQPAPAPPPAPAPAPAPKDAAPAAVYYANCAAARAAGAAPLRAGQPGYREQMDGDRDGIACE